MLGGNFNFFKFQRMASASSCLVRPPNAYILVQQFGLNSATRPDTQTLCKSKTETTMDKHPQKPNRKGVVSVAKMTLSPAVSSWPTPLRQSAAVLLLLLDKGCSSAFAHASPMLQLRRKDLSTCVSVDAAFAREGAGCGAQEGRYVSW